jgi:DNA-binding protein HU-beta
MANAVSTSQLVDEVAQRTGMTKADAKRAVSAIFDAMTERLAAGDRIQLSGFGSFEIRNRAERQGTNPRTREKVTIPASKAVGFRAASSLKSRVGAGGHGRTKQPCCLHPSSFILPTSSLADVQVQLARL